MKKKIQMIRSSLALQDALTRANLAKLILGDSSLCVNLYNTAADPLSKSKLQKVFTVVETFNQNGHIYYAVNHPKKIYLSAFQHCVEKSMINPWIDYFCLGKFEEDIRDNANLQIYKKFVSDIDPVTDITQKKHWNDFIQYIQQVALQNGTYNLIVPSFSNEAIYHDPYIASLGSEFPEIYLTLQKCNDSRSYLRILEIHPKTVK